jgi:hypothetical protein
MDECKHASGYGAWKEECRYSCEHCDAKECDVLRKELTQERACRDLLAGDLRIVLKRELVLAELLREVAQSVPRKLHDPEEVAISMKPELWDKVMESII